MWLNVALTIPVIVSRIVSRSVCVGTDTHVYLINQAVEGVSKECILSLLFLSSDIA